MTQNFYEILGVDKNATEEEVKKGYKKKALQTHPDKLPANATAEAKRQAEEQFRLVSNAYEVLRDQGNRQACTALSVILFLVNPNSLKLYDLHGVWPPPQAGRSSNRGPSASTPFPPDQWPFNGQQPFFGDQRSNAQYTDPFMFFDSIFRDVFPAMHHGHFSHNHQHDHHHDPTFSFHTGPHHRHRHISSLGRGNAPGMFGDAFMNDPFFNNANAASNPFGPGFPFGNMFPSVVGGMSSSASTTFTNSGNRRGRWMSESRSTVISNGQKTSTWERLDQEVEESTSLVPIQMEGRRITSTGLNSSPSSLQRRQNDSLTLGLIARPHIALRLLLKNGDPVNELAPLKVMLSKLDLGLVNNAKPR
ncbi:hypothetical protein BDV98DRAFT_592492 [Pterulicium gracile]|uniref:J domain-containing protein n=1 Tax=Pterulicium gracile TaxID=1884261 RepID=A0A5C3QLF4_9AGAR|nr:hypothetical protein BDV98DRAFT_592492 [Pterula gracilis]